MKQFWALLWCISSIFAHKSQENQLQDIKITNKIKPKMLEYQFLKISYSPDIFKLKVNDAELKPNSSMSLPGNQKTMTVRYDYSFANGWRTGAKEIVFELDSQNSDCDLEFSWDNEWRVVASGAKPKQVKRVKFHA